MLLWVEVLLMTPGPRRASLLSAMRCGKGLLNGWEVTASMTLRRHRFLAPDRYPFQTQRRPPCGIPHHTQGSHCC